MGRELSFGLDLGPAFVDSLFAHVRGHDAARPAAFVAGRRAVAPAAGRIMTTLSIGLLYGGATLVEMFSCMPIAFALGPVATRFMIAFLPVASVATITRYLYSV